MSFHFPGIRVNAIGGLSQANDGNRILTAFSPNPSHTHHGGVYLGDTGKAVSVRPRLLRFLARRT